MRPPDTPRLGVPLRGRLRVARPYPAYVREHSPDYGTYQGGRVRKTEDDIGQVPGFKIGTEILRESAATRRRKVSHEDAKTTASSEAGRAWASGQLVFNAGSIESAQSGFADYAADYESAKELRARVNRTILEDLEARVLALRALHTRLRDMDAGESFGDIVARSRPESEMLSARGQPWFPRGVRVRIPAACLGCAGE